MPLDLSKPVQWEECGRFHTGRVAIARYSPTLTGQVKHLLMTTAPPLVEHYAILIRHSHTGQLEFVAERSLSNYPSEPIPEPVERGGGE